MKAIILSTTRARDDDLVVQLASERGVFNAYRFYGCRHSVLLPGRHIDFELEHTGVFLPKIRRIMQLPLGFERYAGLDFAAISASKIAQNFGANSREQMQNSCAEISPAAAQNFPPTAAQNLPKISGKNFLNFFVFYKFIQQLSAHLRGLFPPSDLYYTELLALSSELEIARAERAALNAAARILSAQGQLGAQSACHRCGVALSDRCKIGGALLLYCTSCGSSKPYELGVLSAFIASKNCAVLSDEQVSEIFSTTPLFDADF